MGSQLILLLRVHHSQGVMMGAAGAPGMRAQAPSSVLAHLTSKERCRRTRQAANLLESHFTKDRHYALLVFIPLRLGQCPVYYRSKQINNSMSE